MTALLNKLKKNKFLSEFLNYGSLVQFAKYVATGLLSAGIEYSTFRVFFDWGKLSLILSNSFSMGLGFVAGFLINRFWSFKSKDNILKQFSLTGILFLINLGISNLLMQVITGTLKIVPSISKLLVMGLIVLWNFIIYKKIIYRK